MKIQQQCFATVFCALAFLSLAAPGPSLANEQAQPAQVAAAIQVAGARGLVPSRYLELNLQELMDIEITTAAKKARKLSDSSAAAYVLTEDDIRRSGATSIMDALRLVPGVEVAAINRHTYAITIRGFNDRFANKLLVLIDGRSVYTPLFAGTYWDVQDTVLEDIERIEVVRGPGGTLWGANAVNGVINIITKRAQDTQGTLISALGGNEEQGTFVVRHGAKIGDNAYMRVYAKSLEREGFEGPTVPIGDDQWRNVRGGGRLDWEASETDSLTVQGEYYDGQSFARQVEPTLSAPFTTGRFRAETDFAGGNILGRWKHLLGGGEQTELQVYYDRVDRQANNFNQYRNTIDIAFQHDLPIGDNSELIWGLGYRYVNDQHSNSIVFTLTPPDDTVNVFSAFIQDETSLLDDRLVLTLGSKFEQTDYTGFEAQPTARFLFKPADRHTIWGAVSRAVRSPSRVENDIEIFSRVLPTNALAPGVPPSPAAVLLRGNRDVDSEELLALELGYRPQLSDTVSLDIAGFYNDYDTLRAVVQRSSFEADPRLGIAIVADATNKMEGEGYGGELSADWVPSQRTQFRLGYSFLRLNLRLDPSVTVASIDEGFEDASPRNRAFMRGLFQLSADLELNATLRWVDGFSVNGTRVASYFTGDLRLGWLPVDGLEIALVGRNLTENEHFEFGESAFASGQATPVERSGYLMVTWER